MSITIRPSSPKRAYNYWKHYYDPNADAQTAPMAFALGYDFVEGGRKVNFSGKTPGFRTKMAKGELIPFTVLDVEQERTSVLTPSFTGKAYMSNQSPDCSTWYTLYKGEAACVTYLAGTLDGYPEDSDEGMLLQRAAANAKEGALMVLVELAEMRKSVDLIVGFTDRLKQRRDWCVRQTKKRHKSGFAARAEALGAFGDVWMESRYGWGNMVRAAKDVQTAINLLTGDEHFTRSGHAYEMKKNQSSDCTAYIASPINAEVTSKSTSVTDINRAVVSVQISKNAAAFDTNIPAFALEIMPYTWVLDWLVNISDIAKAHWPNPGISGQVAAVSKQRTESVGVYYKGVPQACDLTFTSGFARYEKRSYRREPRGDIPFNLSWNPHMGWKNVVDAVSLAAQNYRKIPYHLRP